MKQPNGKPFPNITLELMDIGSYKDQNKFIYRLLNYIQTFGDIIIIKCF